ncbi:MAG TPA: hypothetical protein VG435_16880 [Acidimicrobiales bacterium]|jgi:hypothetical protein|nr:hypothetical protein [Acidimicrobiales bacterium]
MSEEPMDELLSAADDLPIHQIAEPVAVVGTSDRNFYDRYYFFAHHCSDEIAVTAGLGQYPNLGVSDAFMAVTRHGRQDVIRSSRELAGDRLDVSVGPISIHVEQGLQRLRLVVEPNAAGIEADLTWDGNIAAHREPRHINRNGPRVTTDSVRFCQTGTWSGLLVVDDQTWRLDDGNWWGARDRSWGIRPVGDSEPPGRRFGSRARGFLWLYGVLRFEDRVVVFIVQEDSAGARSLEHAAMVFADGRPAETLGRPDHDLDIDPLTRQVRAATIRFERSPLELSVSPLAASFLALGTGYGTEPDWRHGLYQGPLAVERQTYDLTDPEVQARTYGLIDSVARVRLGDAEGYGLFEYAVLGRNDRYGPFARPGGGGT